MSDVSFLGVRLPESWGVVSVGDVTSKVGSGATPRGGASVYVDAGTSFIRSQNIYDHEFRTDGLVTITDEAAHALRGVTVESGDILLNITGDSILRVCIVPDEVLPARVSQHVAIIRTGTEVDGLFLQKWLTLPAMKEHMIGHSSGGTRKAVTKGHILGFPIPLPPPSEQRGIAATLGALDDKIQSNARAIEAIREIGDALLREACLGGARHVPLGDVATFHNRRRVPLSSRERDARPGPYPYYGATGVFGYIDDYLFDEILVLVGEDGSVVREDGTPFVQYIWGKAWINNHAHPLTGNGISNELLLVALARADVGHLVTGAVQPKISMGNLKALQLELPPEPLVESVETQLAALFALLRTRADENRVLTTLRDALLPQLFSGRIRVPEAADAGGEVLA